MPSPSAASVMPSSSFHLILVGLSSSPSTKGNFLPRTLVLWWTCMPELSMICHQSCFSSISICHLFWYIWIGSFGINYMGYFSKNKARKRNIRPTFSLLAINIAIVAFVQFSDGFETLIRIKKISFFVSIRLRDFPMYCLRGPSQHFKNRWTCWWCILLIGN